ncbi:Hemin import ATP-binding protein HmuV [Pseudoalteromonas holothuriae]|uniref:Hemin import ATP-binding protein HmuV n=1 Tax=Pseudoalteromonas holothuriae TaxID=2963714 RepID=A0A9W4QRT9_9GAMM|nr:MULTISPECIES: heme ABC transporter ATP-binding protein [unclassified Pseudoalteromonas]CAH9050397.1 Hemin import ATP-binding protein HmuV [Pseudoalteromonas sp. CIP111854]CAH9068020.1 Hemin import ATP-binding protein HmuV [Pseudoalteromonas sp. CIP111951]
MLSCQQLSIQRGQKCILQAVNFTLNSGEFVVLLGENGAGKSTLLSAICGDIPFSGNICFANKAIAAHNEQALATKRAVLLQNNRVNFAFSAAQLIAMGRYPYHESENEQAAVVNTLIAQLNLAKLAPRDITELSGGEFQRVQFARCLAQLNAHKSTTKGKLMLLDEPTSALDMHHQHLTLSKAKAFAQQGNTVVAVLHDLNLTSLYADRVLLLNQGRLCHDGKPQEVLQHSVLQPIYKTDMQITTHPNYQIPMIFSEPERGVTHA